MRTSPDPQTPRGNGAAIGWFESPPNPRDAAKWKWHPLYNAGWVMTLRAFDVDGEGRPDLVVTCEHATDGKIGVFWLSYERHPTATPLAAKAWGDRKTLLPSPTGPWSRLFAGRATPDGGQCVPLDFAGAMSRIDLLAGREARVTLNLRQPYPPSFSADSRFLVCPSALGCLRIWDATTLRESAALSGFALSANSAAFAPDGRHLATGSHRAEAMRWWDTDGNELLLRPQTSDRPPAGRDKNGDSTSPSGERLSANGAVKSSHITPSAWPAAFSGT